MEWDIPSILEGYARGYFLMADERNELGWYTSRERTLIPLDERFRYPKSLRRVLNQQRFSIKINGAFKAVCEGCADRETTWINDELKQIYLSLYYAGWAYSFETWERDRLAGGILGIAICGMFIGESMFYQIPDGSKVAMVKLVEHLRRKKYFMFDVQLQNPHLERFGAYTIGDRDYQVLLAQALSTQCYFV